MPATKKAPKKVMEVQKTIAKSSTKSTAKQAVSSKCRGDDWVQCHQVYVSSDKYGGMGAYASCDIKKGALVEKGIARRLPGLPGNANPFVFTWSEDRSVWACTSGMVMFYNTSPVPEENNTKMDRDFEKDTFAVWATRDIKQHEELRHMYRSLKWRTVFKNDPYLQYSTDKK